MPRTRPIKITVDTVDELIDTLGGTHAAAQLFGVTDAAVANWRARGLPPRRFLTFKHVLASRGIAAPPSLWRMFEAARKEPEAAGKQQGHLFIAEWMVDRELSAEKLAKRLGVDRVTVSRWRNQQHRLNPDKIAAIATALDIDCAQLFRPPPQRATLSQAIGWLAAGLRWQADRGQL